MRDWPPNPAYADGVARYQRDSDATAALPLLRAALEAQPERARIHGHLARVLLLAGKPDEARAAAIRGHALAEPDDPVPALVLSFVLLEVDDVPGAVAAADAALARASDTALTRDAWICRARALIAQEDARQAMAAAREAVRVDPAHAGARVELANALALSDRWGEARAVIARAEALAPEDPWVLDNRKTIEAGLLAVEGTVAGAEGDVAKEPRSFEVWLALGIARTKAGKLREAVEAFDRAHELDPGASELSPDEPHMLSPFEADCRLALLESQS